MKKFLSLLLALTMMLSLCTVAFAADNEATVTSVDTNNTASFDVTGTVTVNEKAYADIAYSVKVAWTVGALTLDIDKDQQYVWNPTTLRYEAGTATTDPASIEAKDIAVTIKLTNSSNAAVNYTVAYADNGNDAWATAVKSGSESNATGKLDNADTIAALTTAYTDDTHAYAIDIAKQGDEGKGTAKEQTYNGTVTLPAINDTTAMKAGTLTLGTYTVTLSKYEAPAEPTFNTVADILNTVPGGFPTTGWSGYSDATSRDEVVLVKTSVLKFAECEAGPALTAAVTESNGNYVVSFDSDVGKCTATFIMTNNVLTSIQLYDGEFTTTYTPPPTIGYILNTVEGGFPTKTDASGNPPANSWVVAGDTSRNAFVWICESADINCLRINDGNVPLTEPVTKGDDGNYTATIDNSNPALVDITTFTFVMNGNVLTEIKYDCEHYRAGQEESKTEYVFTPPTT